MPPDVDTAQPEAPDTNTGPEIKGTFPRDPVVMSESEAEDRLARLMQDNAPAPSPPPNPAPDDARGFDDEDYPEPEPDAVLDAGDDDESPDDPLPDDPLAVDSETEFEWEGKKYLVPKPLVENAMRARKYGDEMKQVAAQRAYLTEQANTLNETMRYNAEVAPLEFQAQTIADQIEQMSELLPRFAGDAEAYRENHEFVQSLKAQQQALTAEISQRKQALTENQKSARQRLIQASEAILARDIPNWGRETYQAIGTHAQELGFTPQELQQIIDPRFIKLAHDSLELKRIKSRRSAARTRAANASQDGPQPAPVVRPGAAAPANAAARANGQGQTTQLIKQARKTGRTADAEAALVALLRGSSRN